MVKTEDLLQGAYDLHIHSAPDVVPRKYTDIELARRLSGIGMKGYAVKSHQFNTGARAAMLRELFPGFNAVGGVTLNRAMGGVNPMAVEMAGRLGARIVWFPTFDSASEQDFLRRTGRQRSYGAGAAPTVESKPITVLDDTGDLIPDAMVVLELIKRHDMIMATGHLGKGESLALVRAGRELGLRRMLVTHPEFPACFATPEEQREYVANGARIEYCYHTVWSGGCPYETVFGMIRAVGPENVVITSDLGQANSPDPEEGLADYLRRLLDNGFSERDVRSFVVDNPKALVE